MSKRVLITGISGQDGSYLTQALLNRGDSVVGLLLRGESSPPPLLANLPEVKQYPERLIFSEGDLLEQALVYNILSEHQPDEIYHLAAISSVAMSFRYPLFTANVNGIGPLRLLEAARMVCPQARIFLAASCEMFGPTTAPATESTPFNPQNPYAASKVMSYWSGVNYRESYDMFISNGILYNHESPRRPPNFLTRKVVRAAVDIALGKRKELPLGNLEAIRDWGYAPEYMDAAIKMLSADSPGDYVIATGESHSVEEFVAGIFNALDMDHRDYVTVDKRFLRPSDSPRIDGNPEKIERELGWKCSTRFADLVKLMAREEMKAAEGTS
jgi:GDPmannose 4,6-dehydratase